MKSQPYVAQHIATPCRGYLASRLLEAHQLATSTLIFSNEMCSGAHHRFFGLPFRSAQCAFPITSTRQPLSVRVMMAFRSRATLPIDVLAKNRLFKAVSIIACSQPLSSYTTPCDVSGDIATNPDEAHDTTWGMAGVPYIAMASSQVSAGRFVGFSVTAPVS
jgi:hypothetical protein